MLKRKISVPKQRPSMPRIVSKLSNLSQRNGFNVAMPKTRFSQNDRTMSSPRLKSFPAEIIRRIEPSPVRNSSENIVTSVHPMMNSGQGDVIPDISYNQLSRSIAMPNQNKTSSSDHEVSRNVCSLNNQLDHSDPAIAGRAMENPSIERAQHRPFVPNHSPTSPNPSRNSPRKYHHEVSQNIVNTTTQGHDPWRVENDSVRRQSVGEPIDDSSKLPNVPGQSGPIVHHESARLAHGTSMTDRNISRPSHSAEPLNSAQIHPPRGHDHYWNNDSCRGQFSRSDSVMTSPQDIAINQIKNHRRTVHFANNWMDDRQSRIGHNLTSPVPSHVNSPHYHDPHGPYGNHEMVNHQSAEQWQSHHYNHGDPNFSHNHQEPVVQSKINEQPKTEMKKKSLRFSPSMIRDQEMLVMTMRQQGISEDIMRRQFDALLAEQRKQLLYLEQLENRGAKSEKKLQQGRTVQRRISRIEEDGKPEWMLHITPPRIPYSVMEKMQAECQIVSPIYQNSNVVESPTANKSDGTEQCYDRGSHDSCQRSWQHQVPGANVWHQHPQNSYSCNNVTNDGQIYNPNVIPPCHQEYYGYPLHNPYQSHQHYHVNPPHETAHSHKNHKEKNQSYEDPEKSVKHIEASSLLKQRVYKDVIKRQKQNNGLQDSETIKKTLEALKNPGKGLEYVENLTKKCEKPVSLNGAQDPNDRTFANVPDSRNNQPTIKTVSANGLENSRNPNNPSRGILRPSRIDEYRELEYPRQRTSMNNRDCHGLMAERENAMDDQRHGHLNGNYSSQNQMTHGAMSMQTRSENAFHNLPRMDSGMGQNSMANHTASMPFQLAHNGQQQFYSQQIQQSREHRGMISDHIVPEYHRTLAQSGFPHDQMSGNVQQYEPQCHLHEPLMIGGVKYLARKPQYAPNTIPMQPYHTNHGNNFNPMIACQ